MSLWLLWGAGDVTARVDLILTVLAEATFVLDEEAAVEVEPRGSLP
jgi:hypothetical protein